MSSDPFGFDAVDPAHLRAARSNKWNRYDADVLAAWVADMDFAVAPCVTEALRHAVENRMHGYAPPELRAELIDVFCDYTNSRTAIGAEPELTRLCDDVVQALHAAVLGCSEPGDAVLVLSPLYPPFFDSISMNRRRVVEHRMTPDYAGVWRIDEVKLRAQIIAERPRVLMLCHPHNPVGRLWSRKELEVFAAMAVEFDLVVVADEIHSDLVFDGRDFVGFASLGPEVKRRTITITSANKAYNLAALKVAMIVFGTDELQARFDERISAKLLGAVSTMGIMATLAAFRQGGPWLDAALGYLAENRDFFVRSMSERVPSVTVVRPEATYLSWLDFSAVPGVVTGPRAGSVKTRLVDEAKVAFNEGESFGPGLEPFARVNLATSRALVGEIVDRVARWVDRQR